MPYGGTSKGQDSRIERCVADLMSKGEKDKSKAIAICKSSIVKKDGEGVLRGARFKYSMPISESVKIEDGGLRISGVAIEATTSRNGRRYLAEELAPSIQSMVGRSIGINHSDDVMDNVGIVESASFDGKFGNYVGVIHNTADHPDIEERVAKRLVQHVSIEADAKSVERVSEGDGDVVVLRGIEFTGLDLVKRPGIVSSSVGIAEAIDAELVKGGFVMDEKIETPVAVAPVVEQVPVQPVAEAVVPEQPKAVEAVMVQEVKEDKALTELRVKVEALEALLKAEKAKGVGIVENQQKPNTVRGLKFYQRDGAVEAVHEDFFGFNARRC